MERQRAVEEMTGAELDKAVVRVKWPKAWKGLNSFVWRCPSPVEDDELELLDMECGPIGDGDTDEEAWANAADKLIEAEYRIRQNGFRFWFFNHRENDGFSTGYETREQCVIAAKRDYVQSNTRPASSSAEPSVEEMWDAIKAEWNVYGPESWQDDYGKWYVSINAGKGTLSGPCDTRLIAIRDVYSRLPKPDQFQSVTEFEVTPMAISEIATNPAPEQGDEQWVRSRHPGSEWKVYGNSDGVSLFRKYVSGYGDFASDSQTLMGLGKDEASAWSDARRRLTSASAKSEEKSEATEVQVREYRGKRIVDFMGDCDEFTRMKRTHFIENELLDYRDFLRSSSSSAAVPAQGDGEPEAQLVAKRLANAIQFFRNCKLLKNLTKLRGTPEYRELCSAWEAHIYLTDTWTDALAELKEYQQREEAVGGDGEDAQTFEQVIDGLRSLEPFWSKAAQDEIKEHETTRAELAAAQERIRELEALVDVVDGHLNRILERTTDWRFTNRDVVIGLEAANARDKIAALRTYADAKGEGNEV